MREGSRSVIWNLEHTTYGFPFPFSFIHNKVEIYRSPGKYCATRQKFSGTTVPYFRGWTTSRITECLGSTQSYNYVLGVLCMYKKIEHQVEGIVTFQESRLHVCLPRIITPHIAVYCVHKNCGSHCTTKGRATDLEPPRLSTA